MSLWKVLFFCNRVVKIWKDLAASVVNLSSSDRFEIASNDIMRLNVLCLDPVCPKAYFDIFVYVILYIHVYSEMNEFFLISKYFVKLSSTFIHPTAYIFLNFMSIYKNAQLSLEFHQESEALELVFLLLIL